MKKNTLEEVALIKKHLNEKEIGWLGSLIFPKCGLIGFCPEEKTCGYIKKLVKDYDEDFHQEMKEDLEDKFQKILKKINE